MSQSTLISHDTNINSFIDKRKYGFSITFQYTFLNDINIWIAERVASEQKAAYP